MEAVSSRPAPGGVLVTGAPLFYCMLLVQDGVSFLNVPYWSDNTTELYSVTLVSGPCSPTAGMAGQPVADMLAAFARAPGCNVRFVNNQTLIPTLLRDATVNTTQPLLVRVVTNVSLGLNLQQPIVMLRPVLILGTSSAPVSVDLGMVVNQLDVSAITAQLAWQAVVLENLAPGTCRHGRVTELNVVLCGHGQVPGGCVAGMQQVLDWAVAGMVHVQDGGLVLAMQ